LRHDPGVLRLHVGHDEGRLHLLRDDERHARLLQLLIAAIRDAGTRSIERCPGPSPISGGGPVSFDPGGAGRGRRRVGEQSPQITQSWGVARPASWAMVI
jgi:hypothetical protein